MAPSSRSRTRAELALAAVTLLWGGTFPLLKMVADEEGASPLLFVGLRFLAALLLYLPFAWRHLRAGSHAWSRAAVTWGVLLGLVALSSYATQFAGLSYTTVTNSAFLTGTSVAFVPVLAWAVLRRPPGWAAAAGVVLCTCGVYLLARPDLGLWNAGDSLTMICAVTYALYIVLLTQASQQHDYRVLVAVQFATLAGGGLLLAPLGDSLSPTGLYLHSVPSLWIGLAYTAGPATVVAYTLMNRYQRDSSPERAAIIYSAEPVVAAVLSYLLLGEVLPGVGGFAGCGLILAGILVSQLWPARGPRPAAPRA